MPRPVVRQLLLYSLDLNNADREDLILAAELFMLEARWRATAEVHDRIQELRGYFLAQHRAQRTGAQNGGGESGDE